MQFTTALSMGFFAALASAHAYHPQHFHHRRHVNGTGISGGPSTALTVFVTNTHTFTSCAPTVTNCPAAIKTGGVVVVTETVPITTTICPVSDAESVSSAIQSSYVASGLNSAKGDVTTTAAFVPVITGAPLGTGSGASPTGGDSGDEDVVLTYTLGAGTSTTVVTTTIKHTSVVATVYATKPAGGKDEANTAAGAAGEKTTTISGTSTSTRYVTVSAVPTGPAGGVGGGAATGPALCAPVTVTVALSTVTVTETAAATNAADGVNAVAVPTAKPTAGSVNVLTPEAEKNGIPSDAVIIVSTVNVVPVPVATVAPAPYSNGTHADGTSSNTKTKCASTFITMGTASPTGY